MTAAAEDLAASAKKRIDLCIETALHASSTSTEIVTAISGAQRLAAKNGISLLDYYQGLRVAVLSRTDPVVVHKLTSSELIEMATLRVERASLASEVTRLQEQVLELEASLAVERAQTAKLTAGKPAWAANPPMAGFVHFEEFAARLYARLGTVKGSLTTFAEATATKTGMIQRWRRHGRVPVAYFEMIDTIDPADVKPIRRQTLTGEHRARIDQLAREGLSDAAIAETMRSEFPYREFNISVVAGAKNQARHSFLTKMRLDGKTREQAAASFLKDYPRARKLDATLDAVFGRQE